MTTWVNRRRVALLVFTAVVAFLLVLPILVIIPVSLTSGVSLQFPPPGLSLQWYHNILADPSWRSSLFLSIRVAVGTTVLSLLLGVPMALGLARARFRGKRLLFGFALTPLLVPTIIVGTGMYFVWTSGWRIGSFGVDLGLYGTSLGLIFAHTTLAIPVVVVMTIASLQTVDPDLELAARGLGATPWASFLYVLLPLILPGLIFGGVFAFLTSWDEPVVALFLSSPTLVTLPVRMFTQVTQSVDPTVAAVSTLLAIFTTIVFLIAFKVEARRR